MQLKSASECATQTQFTYLYRTTSEATVEHHNSKLANHDTRTARCCNVGFHSGVDVCAPKQRTSCLADSRECQRRRVDHFYKLKIFYFHTNCGCVFNYQVCLRLITPSLSQLQRSMHCQAQTLLDLGAIQRLRISVATPSILASKPGISVPTKVGLQSREYT